MTADMTANKARIARQFIEMIPHSRALGMYVTEIGEGTAVIEMPYDAQFIGDPETGVIHGGAVSALMDTCGGAAVMSHPKSPAGTATINLRIDYMRPATPGQTITARAECYHITRSVAFVRATALDEDTDRPVATATGTFTVEDARGSGSVRAGRLGEETEGDAPPSGSEAVGHNPPSGSEAAGKNGGFQ